MPCHHHDAHLHYSIRLYQISSSSFHLASTEYSNRCKDVHEFLWRYSNVQLRNACAWKFFCFVSRSFNQILHDHVNEINAVENCRWKCNRVKSPAKWFIQKFNSLKLKWFYVCFRCNIHRVDIRMWLWIFIECWKKREPIVMP